MHSKIQIPISKTPRYLFLHRGLTNYFLACVQALVSKGIEVYVVYQSENKVPVTLPEDVSIHLYQRERLSKRVLKELCLFIKPDKLFCSGWLDIDYLIVCQRYYQQIPTVMLMDNKWKANWKQRLATLISPLTLRNIFSHLWIAGEPQLRYAQKLGFREEEILFGCLSANVKLFSKFYQEKQGDKIHMPKQLLFVGRYIKEKNLSFLINNFIDLVEEEGEDWVLNCVGDGPLKQRFREHFQVVHHGYLLPHELEPLIKNSTGFVLPSKTEAWGVVIHEMVSSGMPIISSSVVGANVMFLEDGVNGYVFLDGNAYELKKSIKKLMNSNAEVLTSMRKNSYGKGQLWCPEDWAHVANEISLKYNMDDQQQIKVTYFFRKPQPQYFSIEKVFEQVINHLPDDILPLIVKLKNGTTGWWGRMKALWEVRKNKGTINHITGDITFVALVLPKKGLIVTYHDLESLTQYKGWQFKVLKYLWVTIPVRRAQVVTAISHHTKEQLLKWTKVNPDKIAVIPNPLPEKLSYSPKVFNAASLVILIMGTKANKNVEGIMEAIGILGENDNSEGINDKRQREKSLVRNCKSLKLIVVGEMTVEQKTLAKQYSLEIENMVHMPYEEILAAYKRCDLLCFPSFYEGFGLPIIEAQAIGRPVITSNFGAMKEIAGEAALLVSPNNIFEITNALRQIMENKELRNQLIKKGLKNVERFAVQNIVQHYREFYGS